ncbi:MAG: Do family serine endopeptidase [Candidatus Cryptobacteroides sp.]|nr:Do family serine endopeptidase [Candidatus Cryptobacteroides sp.]
MRKSFITVAASAIVAGLTAFGVVKACVPGEMSGSSVIPTDGSAYRTVNLSQSDYPDFTYAAESAVDAVVYVKVTIRQQQSYNVDPFFRFFFGDQATPQSREQQVSGSGVIIRSDGYIVTNNHVVEGATKVEVTLNNNKTYPATIIGTDPATDVAIIKIEADGLPVVPFGDSDQLRLGQWVIAIGSPYDLRSTITAGIVSAKGRQRPHYNGEFKIESFIQTDAAVNPGNSGGALVNQKGELVGVNTAIISHTGSYTGYSFAIPSNLVRKIADDLIDFGSVKRALLGVTMTQIDDKKAKELKLFSPNGVYIEEVLKGGAADKAGIRHGDVIVYVDSTAITTPSSLQEKVSSYNPGDKASVTIIRDGDRKTVEVTFQGAASETGEKDIDGSVAFYGSKIREASKETLAALNLKAGVEIVSVGPGKVQEAGAKEGFIILYVNDQPVTKPDDVINIVKKAKRAVYVEGVTSYGKAAYFAFGKE